MLRFELRLLHGVGTYKKKLDVKTFPFSSSNRGNLSCNDRKNHLSKPLLFVSNQRLPYKLVDKRSFFYFPLSCLGSPGLHRWRDRGATDPTRGRQTQRLPKRQIPALFHSRPGPKLRLCHISRGLWQTQWGRRKYYEIAHITKGCGCKV